MNIEKLGTLLNFINISNDIKNAIVIFNRSKFGISYQINGCNLGAALSSRIRSAGKHINEHIGQLITRTGTMGM